MKMVKKVLRLVGIALLGVFILANLVIVLSGRLYIYKAITATYLRGNTGPSIYDHDVFSNRQVLAGNHTPWQIAPANKQAKLNTDQQAFVESLNPASFLVLWGDTIIHEQYWEPHAVDKTSNSFSMSKSVIALLVGIALQDGDIKSLNEPVANYLPEFKGEKSNITIRHILTMSSGLSWSENYKHPFCDVAELYYDTDARDLALNRRTIEEPPGKIWRYKSGDTQVLMYVLQAASGMNITDYATEKLWQKLGSENNATWSLVSDNLSEEKAYCCLYATSRDFARLGKLINNSGKWNGIQLIDSSYVAEFKSLAPLKKANGKPNQLYGFQYWIYRGLPYEVTYFRGMKGQYIISIPSKNLVIVRTGMGTLHNYDNTKPFEDALEGHRAEIPEYIGIGLSALEQYQIKND